MGSEVWRQVKKGFPIFVALLLLTYGRLDAAHNFLVEPLLQAFDVWLSSIIQIDFSSPLSLVCVCSNSIREAATLLLLGLGIL